MLGKASREENNEGGVRQGKKKTPPYQVSNYSICGIIHIRRVDPSEGPSGHQRLGGEESSTACMTWPVG